MPPPPWMAPPAGPVCDWSEHTSPDGKKYYYNAKTGESVWEKPKELTDFEKRQQKAAASQPPVTSVPPGSEPKPVPKVEDIQAKLEAAKQAAIEAAAKEKAAKNIAAKLEGGASAASKSQDSSRPVSSTPVTGTPWCVVWTGDNRYSKFF